MPGALEDHYAALGVSPDAPQETIRRAYRIEARACHPDVNGGPEAAAAFKRLAAAYEVLGDRDTRRRYDHARSTLPAGRIGGPVPERRGPAPSAARDTVTAVRATPEWTPAPSGPERDEWRSLGRFARLLAVAFVVALLGLGALAFMSVDGADRPSVHYDPQTLCRTPEGWVDCRALDPTSP